MNMNEYAIYDSNTNKHLGFIKSQNRKLAREKVMFFMRLKVHEFHLLKVN